MRIKTENVMRYMPTGETHTMDLYEFHELNDDTRARIVADYSEERQNDPYFSQWFADTTESEIWAAVRDLEKSITGARVQWRYNRWYSCDFDCEFSYDDCYDPGELNRVDDNGICYSMDLCDAWNSHVDKLNATSRAFENVSNYMYDVNSSFDYWNGETYEDRLYSILDDAQSNIVGRWYAELEAACEDVRNMIEYLLRAEWEYYTSEEYARMECEDEYAQGGECRTIDHSGRVYYSDNRRWYTVDGEFYEQSDVCRECVSIVRVA